MLCFTTFLAALLAAGQLVTFVHAHVEMKSPTPFRSKFIVPNSPNTDFSMTAPLSPDGSNFPCKGYHHDSLANVATLTAGSSLPVELSGTATHNGGSCQFSLSYDSGATWIVIHSIMGGCPSDSLTYTVPIPADVPSGDKVLLAWSWENHTGNREFYMNCAPVSVKGTSSSFTGPKMHEANIFGAGTCNTVEGFDTVYPNPGKSVLIGGAFKTSGLGPVTNLANCPFDENVDLTTTGSSSSSSSGKGSSSSNSTGASDSSPSVAASPVVATPINPPAKNPVDSTPTPSPPPPAAAPVPVAAASVAGNTTTNDGQAGAPCTTDGAITCSADGKSFYMCDHDVLVAMGSVAAGTTCSNGQITRKRGIPPQLHRRMHGHKGLF